MIGRPCRAAVSAPTNQARPRHVNNPIHHHADTSRHSKHNRSALTTYPTKPVRHQPPRPSSRVCDPTIGDRRRRRPTPSTSPPRRHAAGSTRSSRPPTSSRGRSRSRVNSASTPQLRTRPRRSSCTDRLARRSTPARKPTRRCAPAGCRTTPAPASPRLSTRLHATDDGATHAPWAAAARHARLFAPVPHSPGLELPAPSSAPGFSTGYSPWPHPTTRLTRPTTTTANFTPHQFSSSPESCPISLARLEQAALKCLYLVTRSLDPTGRGKAQWAMRWKRALNAFAITFNGRITPTGN